VERGHQFGMLPGRPAACPAPPQRSGGHHARYTHGVVQRAFTLLIASIAAGGLWGGIAGIVLGVPPYEFGFIIGALWGSCCSGVLIVTVIRKRLAIVLPVWFAATTVALIVALILTGPHGGLFLPVAASSGAYIVSSIVLAATLSDDPGATPDRSRCHLCGYPRAGLPTNICPECGQRSATMPRR
jgi:hypothetical protein